MIGCHFVDMDTAIERQEKKSVSQIFAENGEEYFREREYQMCLQLGAQQGLVIACGGGAVLRADNVAALKTNGCIVWLQVSAETVLERLSGDSSRPLLQRTDKEQAVRDLLARREPVYRAAADIIVHAFGDPLSVAYKVRHALGL